MDKRECSDMYRHRVGYGLIMFLLCSSPVLAQELIYTTGSWTIKARIIRNTPSFIVYELPDEIPPQKYTIDKREVAAISYSSGMREVIVHDTGNVYRITYFKIDGKGDTLKLNADFDPNSLLSMDPTVKLCRFKNVKEYTGYYGSRSHFYVNDPEKKFAKSSEVTFEGIDFSCMKLVNPLEIPKATLIKNKHLKQLAEDMNNVKLYTPLDFNRKKVQNDISFSVDSYKSLNDVSWVSEKDYHLHAGKIPAIIRSRGFSKKEGIGIIFIIEKFNKQEHIVSGYWVVFDFSDSKTLLLDYISFDAVGSQSGGYGWDNYWGSGLVAAGVYEPVSFQKYLELEAKGKLELVCD